MFTLANKLRNEIAERDGKNFEFARNENSELHKCFEWDDTVAAEKYRLQQAKNIVCNLVYQEEKKEEPTKLRVFYNQSSTNTYQPTRVLVRNEDNYKELSLDYQTLDL